MKNTMWKIIFSSSLVLFSLGLFYLHYLIFHDFHHIFIYLLGDIAFVPVEVLIVSLIIHKVLEKHEKNHKVYKMNMVIGAYFSEVGNKLLSLCKDFDFESKNSMFKDLQQWNAKKFLQKHKLIGECKCRIIVEQGDLLSMKKFLLEKRDFLVRLLENSNVLEHDSFTNLLWAVFHLTEELDYRSSLENLSKADAEHIANDINRVYVLLMKEWLYYLRHLKISYPYLFSLSVRINPFNKNAKIEIT